MAAIKKQSNIQPLPDRFFKENGIEVTERIKNGSTKFFADRMEAELSISKIGYVYELFDVNKNVTGYGVPK